MSNSYANKQPKYSKYVVKNLSAKEVRIFGINIKPGKEFDLLSIPGISQNEIFSSVLKDDIGPRLRSTPPILTVTENTIDLITITLPDADYTLDPVYFDFGTIIFAGTLTAQRNIVFPNYGSTDNKWIIRNNTNQFLNVKTSAGTGSLIQSGLSGVVFSDGANIQGLAANPSDTNSVGGFRSVADITARNAIATQLRKEGMYVYVQSSNEIYKLGSGLTNSDWLFAKDNNAIANLTSLVALNDAEYTERTEFKVLTVEDFFYLDKTSTLTADGITIVNSLSSSSGVYPGRWIRRPSFSTNFLSQRTWYIDPLGGNDENTGATSLLPLKTCKEFNRRVWCYINSGRYVIQYVTSPAVGDPPMFLGTFSPQVNIKQDRTILGAVIFKGSYTSTGVSGTVSASTLANSATNTEWSITDIGITWSSHLRNGHIIRFTSGNLNGLFAIPTVDLGSGRVITTNPVFWDASLTGDAVTTASAAPTVNSTFDIVTFMDCPELDLSQQPSHGYLTQNFVFFNMLGSDLPGGVNKFLKCYSRGQTVHCSLNFNLQIQNGDNTSLFGLVATALNGPSNASQYCLQLVNFGLAYMYYSCAFNQVSAGVWSHLIAQRSNFNNLVQITLGSKLSLQISVFFRGPSALSYAIQIAENAQLDVTTGTVIIGQNATTLFDLYQGGTVRVYQSGVSGSSYSFVSTGPIIRFNGFGYAMPSAQPAASPVNQALTALPTATSLLSLNSAPWLLPSVGSQMPACIVASSMDQTTRFMAIY